MGEGGPCLACTRGGGAGPDQPLWPDPAGLCSCHWPPGSPQAGRLQATALPRHAEAAPEPGGSVRLLWHTALLGQGASILPSVPGACRQPERGSKDFHCGPTIAAAPSQLVVTGLLPPKAAGPGQASARPPGTQGPSRKGQLGEPTAGSQVGLPENAAPPAPTGAPAAPPACPPEW